MIFRFFLNLATMLEYCQKQHSYFCTQRFVQQAPNVTFQSFCEAHKIASLFGLILYLTACCSHSIAKASPAKVLKSAGQWKLVILGYQGELSGAFGMPEMNMYLAEHSSF